ncbi:MAG: cytochrome c3 family protein [Gemmatimonadota bacterium]
MIRRLGLLFAAAVTLFTTPGVAQQRAERFDHTRHARLFVSCALCHAGIDAADAAIFPPSTSCVSCHNGAVQPRVEWQPRSVPRVSNLRFDHRAHSAARRNRGDTTSTCSDCHAPPASGWMQVRAPVAPQCVSCHTAGGGDHLTLPDTACATCHLPLAQARALTRERISAFPAPPSHQLANFVTSSGHGALAKRTTGANRVAQSCATCHARDFCASCHVNASELGAIQALLPDPRSLLAPHVLKAPASHAATDFETRHGKLAGTNAATCRSCHTQESCATCHSGAMPAAARALLAAAPGRAAGAQTVARMPASHTPTWRKAGHGPVAAASNRSCSSCHQRQECLTCHVPNTARRGAFHPAGYLTRHPADGYSRASSCADCHNTGEFCQSCHNQAGVTAKRTLLGASGYHDNNRQFFLGHGKAARQGLESCVSCHVERDCLTCHSVVGGRGFNPHGPGFNAELMLRKNPQLCTACHGTAIPRRRATP